MFLVLVELFWVSFHLLWFDYSFAVNCLYYFVFLVSLISMTFFFIMKGYWVLSKAFSASNEMTLWFLFFSLFMVDCIYRFVYVEPSLHLLDKAYLIMVDDLFDVFLDSFCKYFIENLCIYVHTWNWCIILFWGLSLYVVWVSI